MHFLVVSQLERGLVQTVYLFAAATVASAALGTIFGVLLDVGAPLVKTALRVYSGVLRGLPPLIILLVLFLGLPTLGIQLGPFVTAFAGITLYGSAYMGEIVLSGLKATGRSQRESVRALGIPYGVALRRIYAAQAYRVSWPALFTEATELMKDTALASVVGVVELAEAAQTGAASTFRPLSVFGEAAIPYAVMGSLLLIAQQVGAHLMSDKRTDRKAAERGRRVNVHPARLTGTRRGA